MSFRPSTFTNLEALFEHFRKLGAGDPDIDLSQLPDEISPSGLQLALVRSPITLQNNFTHLSSVSGGLRGFPAKLANHKDLGVFVRPYMQRIQVAQRALSQNNNQLLQDSALITCFMLFAMGLEKKDNALRAYIERCFLKKL